MVTLSSIKPVDLQVRFLTILPRIKTHAGIYFRHVKCCFKKSDFIAEVLALAWRWFVRLAQRGKDATQYPSVLATFAARAVNAGRRLCGQLKAKDVCNERTQRRHGFKVEPLPLSTRTCHEELNGLGGQRHLDAYEERLHENTMTPVDEQAAFRIDFPDWLTTRTERDRRDHRRDGRGREDDAPGQAVRYFAKSCQPAAQGILSGLETLYWRRRDRRVRLTGNVDTSQKGGWPVSTGIWNCSTRFRGQRPSGKLL